MKGTKTGTEDTRRLKNRRSTSNVDLAKNGRFAVLGLSNNDNELLQPTTGGFVVCENLTSTSGSCERAESSRVIVVARETFVFVTFVRCC